MRTLTNENDSLKQHAQQIDRTMGQMKKENEELQQKVIGTNYVDQETNHSFSFSYEIYRKLREKFPCFLL